MNNHYQVTVTTENTDLREIIIALLADAGFDGFEETESELKAYIPAELYDAAILEALLQPHQLAFTAELVEKQNWNAVWESNFEPVTINDFAGIRAHFHPPFGDTVQYEIVITPKMSFGTGHHATTHMVMQLMRDIDFSGKQVFDFGTGTGILAILAEKLGAGEVLATDNDDWCIENATENSMINNCGRITIKKVTDGKESGPFDIIIANINKNIILDNIAYLAAAVQPGGTVLLSGLLEQDEADILEAAGKHQWQHQITISRNGWIACSFKA
ncbi:50S ribosomal protein L11 methyltransferase [Sediminibacterium ginsengisoli]|nr:50S ribosomal protein L11 methyltransferase [Sediminibacterium ginsengisoli]